MSSCSHKEEKIEYFDNGKIMKIANYNGENLDGRYVEYYMNGNIISEGNFKMNKYEGEWKNYYPNGNILSIIIYNEGNLVEINAWDIDSNQVIINGTGNMDLFNSNGTKISHVSYKENQPDGEWTNYYDEGMVLSKIYYEKGTPVGIWKFYNKNGTVQSYKKYSK
ncbi:MAG: hypothetical protein IT232_10625 [Flavobacteriales bacterium]|nr:hypothetical protein [Flavobacteriales bacterium]